MTYSLRRATLRSGSRDRLARRSWAGEGAQSRPPSGLGWSPASPATPRPERARRPRAQAARSARVRAPGLGGWRARRAGAWRPTRASAGECRGSTPRSTACVGWCPSGARIKSCPSMRPCRWHWATSWRWPVSWPRPSDSARSGTGSVSTVSTLAATTTFRLRARSCRVRASPTARGSSASSRSPSRWPVRARPLPGGDAQWSSSGTVALSPGGGQGCVLRLK